MVRHSFVATMLLFAATVNADPETEAAVRNAIVETNNYVLENLRTTPAGYSNLGALEFWSSGGLIQRVPPGGGESSIFEVYTVVPKHIEVVTLVPGQAAVAHYYLEGSEQYAGEPVVSNYLTRCSQAFVKEDGEWKIRSTHWSPILGGAGTTRTAAP